MSRWNREAALLGIPDLPEEAFKHVGDRKIKPQGGGGGGGQTTSTNYQTNVPEQAIPQYLAMLGKGEALSQAPYQAYGGERIAGFTPMQQQSFQNTANQQVAPQVGMGTGLAATGATASFTQPGMAQAFMSPYMQNVVNIQQREALRNAGIQQTQRAGQAVKAGAFGGSRQAIMEAEADRNLMQQMDDIQARGLQSAFESGQSQFNNEMARRLSGAGVMGQLGQQQFGQQMDINRALQSAGALQQQQEQRILDQQYADFQAQRDYPYQQLGFYSDLLRGAGGTTRSIYQSPQPSGFQTLAGLGTAAAGLGRMFKEGGLVSAMPDEYAAGGVVNAPQLSAQLAQMPDQALQQYTQLHKDDPYTVALAVAESRRRAQLRQAAAGAQDATPKEGTVVDREIAGMAEPLDMGLASAVPEDDMEFAEGGIVGYEEGGRVRSPYEQRMDEERQRMIETTSGYLPLIAGAGEYLGRNLLDLNSMPRRLLARSYDKLVVDPMRAFGLNAAYLAPAMTPEGARVESLTPFTDLMRGRTDTAPEEEAPEEGLSAAVTQDDRPRFTNPGYRPEQPAPTPEPVPAGSGSGISAGAVSATGARRPAPAGLAAAVPDFGLDEAERRAREDIKAQTAREKALAEQELSDYEAAMAERGQYGTDKEARIKAKEEGLSQRERMAQGSALFTAGMAMLASRQVGWGAIGEGALKGFGQYRGDMEQLNADRDALAESMDAILEKRRQEEMADGAERRRLRREIGRMEVDGAKQLSALSAKMGLEVRPALAKDVWKEMQANYRTQVQADTTLQAARLRAESGGAGGRETDWSQRYDRAVDNAQKRLDSLIKTVQGSMMTPEQIEAMRQRYLEEEMRSLGLENPNPAPRSGTGVNTTGWGKPVEVKP